MIGVLIRKDPALRAMPPLALGGLAVGGLLGWSASKVGAELDSLGGHFYGPAILQCLVISSMTAIGVAGVRQRCGEMQLALPVPVRTWVGLRFVACLLVGWVPLAAAVTLMRLLAGGAAPDTALRTLSAGAVWAAWVGLCFAWRPERCRLDSGRAFVAILAAGVGLAAASYPWPGPVLALSLVIAVLAGVRVRSGVRRLLFDAAPSTEGGREDEVAADVSGGQVAADGRRVLRVLLARETFLNVRGVVLLVLLVFMAILSSTGPPSAFFWFAPFMAGNAVYIATRALRQIGHLPIARSRLARWVLVPPMVALVVGLTGGAWIAGFTGLGQRDGIDLVGRGEFVKGARRAQRVRVPGALWRFTLGGEPHEICAPWGEVTRVDPLPLVPPLYVINPYDIEPGSSLDFVAWQLARALKASHGFDADPDALRDEYLSVRKGERAGEVIGPFFEQRFGEAHSDLARPKRPGAVALALLGSLLLGLIAAGIATPRGVPPRDRAAWRRFVVLRSSMYAVGIALFFAPIVLPLVLDRASYPSLIETASAALAEWSGERLWLVPGLSLVLAVLGYAWLARRFGRMEVPPPLKQRQSFGT